MTWIILRCSPRSTLRLADTLNGAGFEAWTPRETINRRLPRSQRRENATVPMLPSFVFARSDRMLDLFRLSKTTRKAQPDFSLFRHRDRVPVVSDLALQPVRSTEDRAEMARQRALRARAQPPQFAPGQPVSAPGAFAGLTGRVERQRGRDVIVCFGKITVEIDAWQIIPDAALSARIAA